MMQAWANIRFSTRTVGKLGDSVPTTSNQVPSSHDMVWWSSAVFVQRTIKAPNPNATVLPLLVI